jgi:peptide/nickel transport system substrate-binding protein
VTTASAIARRVSVAGVLWLAALAMGLGSGHTCAFAAGTSPTPSAGTTVLRVGWIMDPDHLNPFIAQNLTSSVIRSLNYDLLVGLDAATMTPTKGAEATGLATDWATSADGTTWTFTLRRDAAWQDGRGPVTAKDVAFTYNFVIDNAMAAFATSTVGIERVEAVDDYTVRVECAGPKADMLNTAASIPVLPEHVWSGIGPKAAASSYPNGPPAVGSGPFQCVEFKRGKYVRMVANKAYWRGAPQIDEVLFEFYTNRDSMAWDLEAGDIDACYQPTYQQEQKLEKSADVTARAFLVNGYDDLVMNCYDPPPGGKSLGHPVLRDPRFRQALQWAVDREKLTQLVYKGIAEPGQTVIAPGFSTDPDWHWSPPASEAYRFDPDRARESLDGAGYRDTDGDGVREYRGRPITLRLWAMSEYSTSGQEVRLIAGWLQEIGIKTDVASMPMSAMFDRIYNTKAGQPLPDFDLCQSGWYLGLDPGQSLSFFTTDLIGGWNDSAFSDEEFDRLFAEQAVTLDTAERKQLVDRMQEIVYEQSPYVVLAYFGDTEAWRKEWAGWTVSPAETGTAVLTADSYLFVHPREAGVEAEEPAGLAWWVLPTAVVGVAVVGGGIVLGRRRRRPEEQ